MTAITKLFEFEACHHLPNYEGKCHYLHGHSYKLEVTVCGDINEDMTDPKQGMVMDFKDLKDIVEKVVISKYDHENLNTYFPNPTAEIMVNKIAADIIGKLPKKVYLLSCKLWETSTSYAEFNMSIHNLRKSILQGIGEYAHKQTLLNPLA